MRLYIWLSELGTISHYSVQQINATGLFNVDVWHLQCRNIRKIIQNCTQIHNTTSSHEELFAGQQSSLTLKSLYAHSLGLHHYITNSLLYLRTIQDKFIALYRELITQFQLYTSAIRIFAKGYLPNTLVSPSKLKEILNEIRMASWTSNPDYDLVINRLHLYYNMKLVVA